MTWKRRSKTLLDNNCPRVLLDFDVDMQEEAKRGWESSRHLSRSKNVNLIVHRLARAASADVVKRAGLGTCCAVLLIGITQH